MTLISPRIAAPRITSVGPFAVAWPGGRATLATGRKPVEWPALNSFLGDRSVAPARVAAITRFIGELGPSERVLLVTHHVIIEALAGVNVGSGEMVVVKRGAAGAAELAGRVKVE